MKLSLLSLAVLPLTLLVGCAADTSPEEGGDISEGAESDLTKSSPNTSVYSTLDRSKCLTQQHTGEFDMPWSESYCGAIDGYVVHIVEGDLRDDVSIMKDKKETELRNLKATGGGFTSIGDTAEWRTTKADTTKPFALIFRQHQDEYDAEGGVFTSSALIVTKLGDKPCIIKVIDATMHKNANELARVAADKAATAKCPKDVPQPE